MSTDKTLDRLIDELTGIRTALDQLVAVFTATDDGHAAPAAKPSRDRRRLRGSDAARHAILAAANSDPARWWPASSLTMAAGDFPADTLSKSIGDLVRLGQLETNGEATRARRFRMPNGEAIPGDPTPPTPDPSPPPATPTTAPPALEPTGPEPQAPAAPTPDVPDIEPTPDGYGANGGGGGASLQRADETRKLDERIVLRALLASDRRSTRGLAQDTGLPRRKIEDDYLPDLLARGLVGQAGRDTLEGELWTLTERARRDLERAMVA